MCVIVPCRGGGGACGCTGGRGMQEVRGGVRVVGGDMQVCFLWMIGSRLFPCCGRRKRLCAQVCVCGVGGWVGGCMYVYVCVCRCRGLSKRWRTCTAFAGGATLQDWLCPPMKVSFAIHEPPRSTPTHIAIHQPPHSAPTHIQPEAQNVSMGSPGTTRESAGWVGGGGGGGGGDGGGGGGVSRKQVLTCVEEESWRAE